MDDQPSDLESEILKRAEVSTNPKARQRVLEVQLPMIRDFGQKEGINYLRRIDNDSFNLARNPADPCGGDQYKGWTHKDIDDLYFILYGKRPEDD